MAIRWFLSISFLIHAMVLMIFYFLYPDLSAEAIRKEMLVYIVEPAASVKTVGESAGKIEEDRSGPVHIAVEEGSMNIAAVSEERDELLPLSEGQAEEFASAAGSDKEFTGRGDVGPPNAGDSGGDDNSAMLREVILRKIRVRKTYPVTARKVGLEGDVHMSFRVLTNGKIRDIAANGKHEKLTILEKAAVELIQSASPFPLPPSADIRADGVPVQFVISYQLENRKGGVRE